MFDAVSVKKTNKEAESKKLKVTLPLFSAIIMEVFLRDDLETADISAEKAHSLSVLLTSWTVATSKRLLRL